MVGADEGRYFIQQINVDLVTQKDCGGDVSDDLRNHQSGASLIQAKAV
jgi:hypothetical protein